ncbi:hypothetical protein [Leptospira biflexa]|uniref:hypothetical protein n=1 Tax=Leptospira biflexa TaxID=172 RepID=UPI001082C5A5|nr:hypothetical protein [Leptospira biflexa]TGM34030.1 hypothetical protein EHQ89_12510 [Leptospira biflexa]TGM40311.1 hypothetical protein EHQ80_03825 [Leptospira biflexa]
MEIQKILADPEAFQSKDSRKAFELAFGFVNDTNIDMRMERERVYQELGDKLLKDKPQVITLRVKEDINLKGHTISLHRNAPDVNGKVTYTVVDTGNSKMNGTIFDPENPLESTLGMSDIQNAYSNHLPRRFDYIK